MPQSFAKDCPSAVVPGMRYRDCLKAIEWLVEALGFEKKVVFEGNGGTVEHAELTFGNGMVMLGSAGNVTEMSQWMVQPDEIGMRETRTTYLVAEDAAALYAQAKAVGAEMVQELREMSYGGKAFTCRDPEGHLWSVGEYDPWYKE